MAHLSIVSYESIVELDLLMKPGYFAALGSINLCGNNIVTTPGSISRFGRLESLAILDCNLLRVFQGIPQSITQVDAENCMLLDTQSPSELLSQVSLFLEDIYRNNFCYFL